LIFPFSGKLLRDSALPLARMRGHFKLSAQGWIWLGAVLVIVTAIGFHFGSLDNLPPGLNRDAAAKGLLALKWLRSGVFPFWIPHASAPEPLMVWLEALTIRLMGPSAVALTGVSAGATVLSALASYGLGLEVGRLFGDQQRVWAALFAGLGLAVNVVVSELGRSGLRATLLPSLEGFTFWALLVALRTGHTRYFGLAGLLLGATAYTYLAARLIPVVLGVFLGVSWLVRPNLRSRLKTIVIMIAVAAVVILPQILFFWRFPAAFFERASAVGFTSNPLYAQVGFWGVLLRKVVGWLLMIGVQWSGQYNQSARPLLQPLAFVGWLVALPIIVKRWREPGLLLLTIALFGMLLPDLLAGDRLTPHEMRVIGAVIPIQVLSGIGLASALGWLRTKTPHWRWIGVGAVIVLVGWGFGDLYWVVAPRLRASTYAWYARPETAEADFINSSQMPILLPLSEYTRSPVAYLSSQRVKQVRGGLDPAGRVVHPSSERVFLLWPESTDHERAEGISYRFDPHALVLIDQGQAFIMPPPGASLSQLLSSFESRGIYTPTGKLAAQVYDLSFNQFMFPALIAPQWKVDQTFEGGLRLLGVTTDQTALPRAGYLGVTSFWQATEQARQNFRYFVHLLDDWQQLKATEDVMPAYGVYDTMEWEPGAIIPIRQLVQVPADLPPGRYWLEIGWYHPLSGERPTSVDGSGNPTGDRALVGPLKVSLAATVTSPTEAPLSAQFSGQIALRGYQLQIRARQIEVSLRFQALARPVADYTLFLHLDNAQGEIVAQTDVMPLEGRYPTSIWDLGEIIVTDMVVTLPGDLRPGEYTLWMGMYNWQTGQRLSIQAEAQTAADRLLLETIRISP
jgi:hypothetical protein